MWQIANGALNAVAWLLFSKNGRIVLLSLGVMVALSYGACHFYSQGEEAERARQADANAHTQSRIDNAQRRFDLGPPVIDRLREGEF